MPLSRIKAAKRAADLARAAAHPDEGDDDEIHDGDVGGAEEREEKADGATATATPAGRKLALSSADRTERRRRQCRISQRRYRDKKGSMEYNLRLDINNLRESVERLRQARGLLASKIENNRRVLQQSVLKAVEQYYVMFEFGLHDPFAGAHVRKCYEIQVNFLRAFMDPRVQAGDAVGVDSVLEQWRRYTRYHTAIRVELLSAQVFGSDSDSPLVKATGKLMVTFNRTTLEKLFPRVLADEALTQFLVGRQVEYATCTEFMFDEKVQVVRQDFTVDFLAGLDAVLQDTFLTSAMLRDALIASSSVLVPNARDAEVKKEVMDDEDAEEEKHPAVVSSAPFISRRRYATEDAGRDESTADDGSAQLHRQKLEFILL